MIMNSPRLLSSLLILASLTLSLTSFAEDITPTGTSNGILTDRQIFQKIYETKTASLAKAYADVTLIRAQAFADGDSSEVTSLDRSLKKIDLDMINTAIEYLSSCARSSQETNEQSLGVLAGSITYFTSERERLESRVTLNAENSAEQGAAANP